MESIDCPRGYMPYFYNARAAYEMRMHVIQHSVIYYMISVKRWLDECSLVNAEV